MWSNRKIFGLAITEQGLSAVEASSSAGRRTILHVAELAFTEEIGLSQPERLGKELRHTLRQAGFGSSRCVVGLGAGSVVSREKTLPPADAESLRGIIGITTEKEFASGSQELVFDYTSSNSEKGLNVLMTAAPRRLMEQLAVMAEAARIRIDAVTSSTIVLALATGREVQPAGRLVVCLLPHAVELAAQGVNGVSMIRRLGVRVDAADGLASLSRELRRVLALAPVQSNEGAGRELLIWNAAGVEPEALESLGGPLGVDIHVCSLPNEMKLANSSPAPAGEKFAQAAALALAPSPGINFLHSRLTPPKQSRVGRRTAAAVAAAVALIAGGVYLWLDLDKGHQEVAALQRKVDGFKDHTKAAKELVDTVTFARTWFDQRPRHLDCLRDISLAFPEDNRIWATSLVIKEDMATVLQGRSVNDSAIREVMEKLEANRDLGDFKDLGVRSTGGNTKDVSFGVSLTLKGSNPAASGPETSKGAR